MRFVYELKKLVFAPAVVGIAVLCVVVNIVVIFALNNQSYGETYEPEIFDIFDNYRTSEIAEGYISKYNLSGAQAKNVRALYDKLQPIIEQKSVNGDSLSPYFGRNTYYIHGLLFGIVFPILIAETCLIALFLTLLSTGYEKFQNTEMLICASKSGRKILRIKLLASLTSGFAFIIVIFSLTFMLFFARFNFSAVWNDNISSGFNYAIGAYGKPLITWVSFTVSQYFWATVSVSVGLAACFSLIGFAAGATIRRGYASCLAAITICGLMYTIKFIFPIGSHLRGILNLSPVWLWLNSGQWFSDGSADILYANFEILGLVLSFIIFAGLSIISAIYYNRRDLV